MEYNGHRNWNHWNVSLWLSNDEGNYYSMLLCLRQFKTKDEAAWALLKNLPEKTPDGAPYSFSSVRAAMVGM